MAERKNPIHRAWGMLLCMILIQGSIIGLLVNSAGVLFAAVRTDMGFRAGDLSIYYTIRQLVMAVSVGITSKAFFEKNEKLVMGFLALCSGLSYVLMGFFTQLWQWYLAAAMMGFGMSCCMVTIPIMLNNWFSKNRGLVIGITMSASGMMGALFSPICSQLISTLGWRATAIITGIITLIMSLSGSLFLTASPEKVGLLPYGGKTSSHDDTSEKKVDFQHQVPKWVYPAAVIALLGTNSYTQFNNQLPTFAQSIGYPLGVGALLTSITMVGNITGKLSLGVISDKLGIYRAIELLLFMVCASQAAFLLAPGSLLMLQIGALLYGFVYALGTTAPSLLFLNLYGPSLYKGKVSLTQSISSFIMAFAGSFFPYIFDFAGSFQPVFILGIFISVSGLLIIFRLGHFAKMRATAEE